MGVPEKGVEPPGGEGAGGVTVPLAVSLIQLKLPTKP